MRWIKLFCLSSVLFISAVIFGSQPTYATSQSFDFTTNPGRNYVFWDSSNNTLGFTPTFVKVENISTGSCSGSQQSFYGVISAFYYTNFSDSATAWLNSDCSFVLTMSLMPTLNSLKFMSYSFPVSFRLTFYDSDPFVSEPCPDCPEIPDDSQTLVDIKNAIIYIPAVMIVIYFFYIMFGWYLGGRS